jgi:biopolymer transport protein ExbD
MPKIKLPRKSTHIDMTAMCDVAFLLLTFFMLATKFKPEEPVQVRTPASVSTDQIPEGFLLITLDKNGRVFFSMDNLNDRQALIEKISEDKGLNLTQSQITNYINGSSLGVPFSQLPAYLSASPAEQSEMDKAAPGIPTDTTGDFQTNELAYWIVSARYTNPQIRIAIKADGESGYPEIHKVIETLGKQNIFRFNFITDMKGVPSGTALAEEQAGRTPAQ